MTGETTDELEDLDSSWCGGVLGLAAAFAAKTVLNKKPAEVLVASEGMTQIVVAKHSIGPGQEIKPDDLGLASISSTDVPEQSFLGLDKVVGRTPTVPMAKGQPVTETVLAPTGAGTGVTALIPDGMRAITIEVNEFSGLAGMVSPGNRVDVVTTIQSDQTHASVSRAVVQNVKILAVGTRTTPKADNKGEAPEPFRSVTLLTSREDAEIVDLIAATSRPRLSLRSGLDVKNEKTEGVTLDDLRGGNTHSALAKATPADPFGGKDPLAQPVISSEAARKTSRVIKTIRGGVSSEVEIPLDDSSAPKTPAFEDSKQVTDTPSVISDK